MHLPQVIQDYRFILDSTESSVLLQRFHIIIGCYIVFLPLFIQPPYPVVTIGPGLAVSCFFRTLQNDNVEAVCDRKIICNIRDLRFKRKQFQVEPWLGTDILQRFTRPRKEELKIKLGDHRGAAWCLNSVGMVCDLQGRYREALVNELEAMKIYREIGDESGQGEVHFSIGSAYFYLGNYEASIKHYKEAREIGVEKRKHRPVEKSSERNGIDIFGVGKV